MTSLEEYKNSNSHKLASATGPPYCCVLPFNSAFFFLFYQIKFANDANDRVLYALQTSTSEVCARNHFYNHIGVSVIVYYTTHILQKGSAEIMIGVRSFVSEAHDLRALEYSSVSQANQLRYYFIFSSPEIRNVLREKILV